jgi:GNAT superfamily N-acetyltransferase
MGEVGRKVVELGEDDVREVVGVLCESFFDYPTMRFVLGPDPRRYENQLQTLVHFFVMARVLRGEILLGIESDEGLSAAALVSRPTGPEAPPELGDLREKVWAELGTSARGRYEAFGAACAPFQVAAPHIHLNMVGVCRRAQGQGLGRLLIEYVHVLSYEDSESEGVTLTTEDPTNVPLYEYLGYQVVGRAVVAPELRTWGFFRPD